MKVKILDENAKLPIYSTENSAGADVFSPLDLMIAPGETIKIPLGIAIELNPDEVAIMCERSSQGFKGIIAVSQIIDPDYRGQISMVLQNNSKIYCYIKKEERIGQIIVVKLGEREIIPVVELSETSRNDGGFGSTGK